ncbi:ABC transporter permease [Bacteroidota bacterium]
MLRNFIKIAYRNLINQRIYSLINISGLAIGIAVCIIILLYIRAERSYDKHNEHVDNIYRLEVQFLNSNGEVKGAFSSLAPSYTIFLEKEFPEIRNITRIYKARDARITKKTNSFIEQNVFFAENDIFEIFTIPMTSGNPEKALTDPFSVVLSETAAEKYFGNEDPIGENLKIRDKTYQVTGIIKDSPYYSHIHFDIIASYLSLRDLGGSYNIEEDYFLGTDNFSDNVTYTYARLTEGTDEVKLQSKMPEFLNRTLPIFHTEDGRIVYGSQRTNIFLRKLTDIHLQAHNPNEIEPAGDEGYVNLFTMVAIFILIIACVNFINLSTARGTKRAKEVGLRKVSGADRKLLLSQFIGESIFLSLISMVIAVILVLLVLPYIEGIVGTSLKLYLMFNLSGVLLLIGVFLITGLISGIYPAIILSSFKPAAILRGEITKGVRGALFRKILVVFQFVISAILIISVSIIYKQMNYLMNTDLGFNRENVLLLPLDDSVESQWEDVKRNLLRDTRVVSATISKRAPSGRLLDSPGFEVEVNGEILKSTAHMPHNRVGYDFFKTYRMEMVAGRDFSIEHPTDDSLAYIINETACTRLGWKNPDDAIGARFTAYGFNEGRIIGVVKDFNYESLHQRIIPIVTYIAKRSANTIALRIASGNFKETLSYIENIFNQYNPGATLEYSFLDDKLEAQYHNEAKMLELFSYFSILTIIISCLGLLGLASYTAEQKTKEIGIRKALGATVSNISFLLSKQFAKWIIIANLIACVIVYFFMSSWLESFAYSTKMGILVFILGIGITLFIALATVSYQTMKAAIANPVEALKHE